MYCSFPLFTTQSLLLFNVCKNIKIKLMAKNMTTSISFVFFLVISPAQPIASSCFLSVQ